MRNGLPRGRWLCIAAWALTMAAVTAISSVRAYRPPWSLTVNLVEQFPGLLASDPIAGFTTPYVSYATLDSAIVCGASAVASAEDLAGRKLVQIEGGGILRPRTAQFRPCDIIRLAVISASRVNPPTRATIGYDGRSPAVSVLFYWWRWLAGVFVAGVGVLSLTKFQRVRIRAAGFAQRVAVEHRTLLWILLTGVALRVSLIWLGGQYFDWDEHRYGAGVARVFDLLSTGNVRDALDVVLRSPDHPAFRVVGLAAAFFHVPAARVSGYPISEMRAYSGEWVAAVVLSLGSVISIGLTYAIAHRAGASRRESELAAFLMLASTSMLMHARHFFPYHPALALMLTAVWIGIKRDETFLRSFGAGVLSTLAFLTYLGFWLLVPIVGALVVFRRPLTISRAARRLGGFALGAFTLPALLHVAGQVRGVTPLQNMIAFSRTVVHGEYAEGWSLGWKYLWHAEHLLLLVYLFGSMIVVWRARRAIRWLLAAAGIYVGLGLGSHVFERFVVYDRLILQMMPFICLSAAAGLSSIAAGRRWVLVAIAAMFVWNVTPLLRVQFPREVAAEAIARFGSASLRYDMTVADASNATRELFLSPVGGAGPYVLLNAQDIWVPGGSMRTIPPPAGSVLLRVRHPRQLPIMQYHGYTSVQRAVARKADLSMQIVKTSAAP